MRATIGATVGVLVWLTASPAGAPAPKAVPEPARFTITRAASAVKIDGVLDEDAWARAAVVPLPFEWSPGDNTPPPVRTDCLITYDRDNLYIAFRAQDPDPRSIRAHLMDRDDTDTLSQDDHIGFMIDTFNDERRGFQFRVNPLGVQADAVFSEQDGVEDFSWDMIWAAQGRITSDGYVVETALPLKQLRFPGGGRLYRANLVQAKGIYHINVRTFVRAILQYTDITRAPALYGFPVDARSRRLFSQFLFSFKLNPQTVFFAGYSDNSEGAGEARRPIDMMRQNRTFFLKLGYVWVL